ncbi:SynChlorMet cassette protein ScmC [bacterium]|nr:SynChlorMet cassette protein ScmC [bacterium]
MSELDSDNCYRLELSNHQVWNIVSDDETSEITDEFASILMLHKSSPAKEAYTLTFCSAQTKITNLANNWIVRFSDNISYRDKILKMWSSLLPVYKQAMSSNGIPLHAALIERNGEGIIIAAPGGTGKTTCCKRLPEGWNALCDDETLLIPDTKENVFNAHPFPTWSNFLLDRSPKNWDVGAYIPVKSIFFLHQADTDRIEPLGQGNSTALIHQSSGQICRRIWNWLDKKEQCLWKSLLFDLAGNLALKIPAFSLFTSLNGEFWKLIESVNDKPKET